MSFLRVPAAVCVLFFQTLTSQQYIPESFDARIQWPFCESIGRIRNERNSTATWVFAATSVMTDRLCIQSGGTVNFDFSIEDLLSCCPNSTKNEYDDVSSTVQAMECWIHSGIVSGGDYNNPTGCKPYSPSTATTQDIPKCQKMCQVDYNKLYDQDKVYGENYKFVIRPPSNIQEEIMSNGPVIASFLLYDDFKEYKGGVYERALLTNYLGMMSVKILGWGIEDGRPYWLIANSWGTQWGEKGYVRFLRGVNEMNIELNVIAIKARFNGASSLSFAVIFLSLTFLIDFLS